MIYRIFTLLCFCLFLSTSNAAETILNYDSEITIFEDATMSVVETIEVTVEGKQIKRGIYRGFPTDYKDRLGNHYRVGFEVLQVLRNIVSEPYRIEKRGNGIRVYIGDKNILNWYDFLEEEPLAKTIKTIPLENRKEYTSIFWNLAFLVQSP